MTLFTSFPKYALSPLTMLYCYYGAWFVVAPMFATRYQGLLGTPDYSLSFAFAYSVFGIGVIFISLGERIAERSANNYLKLKLVKNEKIYTDAEKQLVMPFLTFSILYLIASASVVLIIVNSGGFLYWITAPGDAFLNRGGTGIYVVASHFSSLALAAVTGFYAYNNKRYWPLLLFIVWVLLTSPVHGSKYQISLLLILAILPWIKNVSILSKQAMVLFLALSGVFFVGLYFRNMSWISFSTILPYSLNYFTALENLAISIRDFDPQFMLTFFLPFNKFLTPIGLSSPDLYYDMNHYLTDIYYPHAWDIRATEQWPVETDLYLNFYFFGGLPIAAIFFAVHGFVYRVARQKNSLGWWFVTTIMILSMISHLRGSIYNHVDFYMYPYLLCMLYLMRNLTYKHNQKTPCDISNGDKIGSHDSR